MYQRIVFHAQFWLDAAEEENALQPLLSRSGTYCMALLDLGAPARSSAHSNSNNRLKTQGIVHSNHCSSLAVVHVNLHSGLACET